MKHCIVVSLFFLNMIAIFPSQAIPVDQNLGDIQAVVFSEKIFTRLAARLEVASDDKDSVLDKILEHFSLKNDELHRSFFIVVMSEVFEKYMTENVESFSDNKLDSICDEILITFAKNVQDMYANFTNKKKQGRRIFKKRYVLALLFLLGFGGITLSITLPKIKLLLEEKWQAFNLSKLFLALGLMKADEKEKISLEEIEENCECAAKMFQEAESIYELNENYAYAAKMFQEAESECAKQEEMRILAIQRRVAEQLEKEKKEMCERIRKVAGEISQARAANSNQNSNQGNSNLFTDDNQSNMKKASALGVCAMVCIIGAML